jgi:hypothetical protein
MGFRPFLNHPRLFGKTRLSAIELRSSYSGGQNRARRAEPGFARELPVT